jgi:hypothetical protein
LKRLQKHHQDSIIDVRAGQSIDIKSIKMYVMLMKFPSEQCEPWSLLNNRGDEDTEWMPYLFMNKNACINAIDQIKKKMGPT